jgi:hypothetical protein
LSHNKNVWIGIVLLLSAWRLAMPLRPAFGQAVVSSDILGQITDPSGAGIPEATVTVMNQRTGFTRTVESDSSGAYLCNGIVAGLYTVSVEKAGFKKYVRTDLDLTASRKLRIDVTMELGQVSETVMVKGGTPLIETETAAVSSEARNDVINELPEAGSTQGGRIGYTFFNYLIPGAAAPKAEAASFDGLPDGPGALRITVDGIRSAESCCQQLPSLEAVDEEKVDTFNAPAEYKTPSTVELVTRQGTNRFHGDAWELYDDKSLEACQFFLPRKQLFHGNTFGGSLDGPIKKDKAFFYFGYEEFKFSNLSVTVSPIATFNVPTALMQQGDFSQLLDPAFVNQYNGGVTVTVKNPLTGQPFSGNVIPPGQFSSVAQNFVKTFWSAPTGNGLLDNYFINALHPYERDKEDGRVDYNFSPRHTFFARFGRTGLRGELPTVGFSLANNFNQSQLFPGRTAGLTDTFILSPHATNEFRFGFSRTLLAFSDPYATEGVLSSAGLQDGAGLTGLPGLSFVNFSGISALTSSKNVDQVKGIADNVSIFKGNHSLKMGMLFNRSDLFSSVPPSPPTFSFTGGLSGYDFADFLLGQPSTITRTLGSASGYLFQNEFGLYVEDSFKMRPGLTLLYGLRYDAQPFSYEKYNKSAAYDLARQALVVPNAETLSLIIPSFPQAQVPLLTPSQAGWPAHNRSLVNTPYDDFSPRFGFAWRPRGKENTVVRGGYGIYRFNTVNTINAPDFFGGPSSAAFVGSQSATQSLINGILTPTIAFPDPFAGFGPASTLSPETITYTTANPNLKLAMVQEYNLTLERQWREWGLRGTYYGDFETGLLYSSDYNQPLPSHQSFQQSARPIPNAYDIFIVQNGGFQRVSGFQTEVRHPTSHGFLFDGSWTWEKCLGDVTQTSDTDVSSVPPLGSGGYYFRNRFKSNCSLQFHQQALFRWVWALPFGRGEAYSSQANKIVNGALGGWRLTGAAVFQTGMWLSPYYTGVDPSGMSPGVGEQLPDRVANGNFPRGQRNGLAAPFFNTAAFICPGGSAINGQANLLSAGCPRSTPQNVGRLGNSSPNIIEGPGSNTWNLAIAKHFPLGHREHTNLEVSAQIANPWNHPTFTPSPSMNLSSPSTVGIYNATREDYIQPWSYGNRKISLNARISF